MTNAGEKPTDEELLALLTAFLKGRDGEAGTPEWEDHQLAFFDVHWIVENDPGRAWRLIQLACSIDLTDLDLGFVAASVLEDVLAEHGDVILERLETEARGDPRMRLMLSGVWRGYMEETMWNRVRLLRERLSKAPQ